MNKTDWNQAFKPLLKQYKGRKHPLEYKNLFQLVVMVVLSARDSDKNINTLAPEFFKKIPDMETLDATSSAELGKMLAKVRGSFKKIEWLKAIAAEIKTDKNIPLTMDKLTALKGVGRKSANVIMREAGVPAEGIMVDLHVVRVAPRLGITKSSDPKKIEEDLMKNISKADWADAGMALSYLGRETCRPSHPEHEHCVMSSSCAYFLANNNKTPKNAITKKAVKKAVKKTVAKKTAKKAVKKTAAKKAAKKRR